MTVTLYSGPACPYCLIVKRFLNANGVDYREIDISKDPVGKAGMEKLSGQTRVPVVDAGGELVVGYNIKKLKKALRLQ